MAAMLAVTARPAAAATTYYVSTSGSDSNSGTQTQPFQTIQHAADLVNPGDTVIVADGVYTGVGTGTSCASSTSRPVVCLSRGGTSSAWVTFRAQNRGGAVIDGQSNTSTHGFRFLSNANYIRVDGFEVRGMGSTTSGASGFLIYSGGHDVVIANNNIHDIGRLCTDHIYGMDGIFIQNAHVTVTQNKIHDIGRFAPGENGCNPSTTNYQNHDHGMYVDGKNDGTAPGAGYVTVTNNLFWNMKRGWPIQVYPDPVTALHILNNTFAYANPYRVGHIIIAASTTDAVISNNVFYQPTTAAINFNAGTQTNMSVSKNLSSNSIANGAPSGVVFSNNLESTDPLFATADFQLQATSPAVDWGLSLSEVPVDVVGVARPQGFAFDLGAWEMTSSGTTTGSTGGGTTSADTTPPAVTITAPSDGASVSRWSTISADATDDVGVASVVFKVDGATIATDTSAPYSTSYNFRHSARGAHTISATATDAAGNATTTTITVYR